MKNLDSKKRVRIISLIFIAAIFVVWGLFYFVISGYISNRTSNQMEQAANQIIERFGGELSQIERLTSSLVQNSDVHALVQEKDMSKFYTQAATLDGLLDTTAINPDLIDSIILFSEDRSYYRLVGRLGNRSCMRLANMVSSMDMPSHLSVDLENRRYIGFADAIKPIGSETAGFAVILIEEERVLELLGTYDQSGLLLVAISANNEIITANTDELHLFDFDSSHQPVIHSRLGITPYRISVTAGPEYMSDSLTYFNVIAIITVAIIAIVLVIYTGILNRSFSNQEKQKALVFSLKKQINAHFTINTLNTLRLLVERGDLIEAETVSMGLISLVRYAYDRDELINIWDEHTVLEDYINIMHSRYNGKLEVDFDFDDRLIDYYMPRMLLQPVIENAIVHGFKEMEAGCIIHVKGEINDSEVIFTVIDNGCGMTENEYAYLTEKMKTAAVSTQGYENIALLNIKNRLFFYFGDSGRLRIIATDSGTKVMLFMPLLTEAGGQ